MKRCLKFMLMAVCAAASWAATASDTGDSLLLWMVDTQDLATDFANSSIKSVADLTLRGTFTDNDGKHVNGARVRVFQGSTAVTTSDGSGVYLDLYEQDSSLNWFLPSDPDERTNMLSFDGAPSYSEPQPGGSYVGPSWADFGAYASTEYSFAIELGFLTDDGDWFTIAYGEIVGYENLNKFHTTDIVEDPRYVAWRSTYSVPEPSSGLLLLIGSALLALNPTFHVRG